MGAAVRALGAAVGVVVLLTFGTVAQAQRTLGFGELRVTAFPGASGQKLQVIERVRPTLQTDFAERVKLVATIEGVLAQGRHPSSELERIMRASDFGPLLEAADCRWPTHANRALRVDRVGDYLKVDRLHLDFYAGAIDVRLGRQALNWGSAQFFNPTDPFPQVLLAEPWRPRRGVNAARASIPFGELNDVAMVVATNDALNELRAAGRVRMNFAGTDVALVGAWRGANRNALVGLDIRGTLGVGYWLEGAYLFGSTPHEEVVVGVDYSFPILERATLFAQYYRNGAGSTDVSSGGLSPPRLATGTGLGVSGPECAAGAFPLGAGSASASADPFAPFTQGRDYAVLGGMLLFVPELSANFALVQNLNDGSSVVVPTVSYNALDWLDVALSAQVPYSLWGRGGEFNPRPEDLRVSVEVPGRGPLTADLSGLVPAATVTLWTRASF